MSKKEQYVAFFCFITVSVYGLAVRQYSINEDRKLAEHEELREELKEYWACKEDLVCQYLHPKAQKAVAKAMMEAKAEAERAAQKR